MLESYSDPSSDFPGNDPYPVLCSRLAEALKERGVHQPDDLGFDNVVAEAVSEAFNRAIPSVPAYLDRTHPDHIGAHVDVYRTALNFSDSELSDVVASLDKKWSYYSHLSPHPDDSIYCDSCGSDNYDTVDIEAENGKITVRHTYGCYSGDEAFEVNSHEALSFLKSMRWIGDEEKVKTLEEIITGFDAIKDKSYLQP